MIIIVGAIIVLASVLGGFSMAGGHAHSLLHPSEVVTIGGAALGAMIMMSTKKMLIDLVGSIISSVKGSPYNRKTYADTFKLMYELMRVTRRDGILMLERHFIDPAESNIFSNYPRLVRNKHLIHFMCDAFGPIIEGTIQEQDKMRELLESEIRVMEQEHHDAVGLLQKTADGLPGFGIVAAVLGIVITMGAISGPVEEVGHKVGAALVGTFLGILLSYGFIGPLAARLELIGAAEVAYYRTLSDIIASFVDLSAPKVIIDQARRGVGSEYRPKRSELEGMFKEAEAAAKA